MNESQTANWQAGVEISGARLDLTRKIAAALNAKDAENERLRTERDQYMKSAVDYGNLSERLLAALKPFADAVNPAKISGHPPFNFVGADDFQRAADVLQQTAEEN